MLTPLEAAATFAMMSPLSILGKGATKLNKAGQIVKRNNILKAVGANVIIQPYWEITEEFFQYDLTNNLTSIYKNNPEKSGFFSMLGEVLGEC